MLIPPFATNPSHTHPAMADSGGYKYHRYGSYELHTYSAILARYRNELYSDSTILGYSYKLYRST